MTGAHKKRKHLVDYKLEMVLEHSCSIVKTSQYKRQMSKHAKILKETEELGTVSRL